MKRWMMVGLLAVMIFTSASFTFADDRVRGRWEGIAIGLGAASLYNLFQHGQLSPVILPRRATYERPGHHYPPPVCEPSGHWEIQRQWIPERRENLWIPSHYEGGYWVPGHYEVRVYPGYYEEHRFWVEGPRY